LHNTSRAPQAPQPTRVGRTFPASPAPASPPAARRHPLLASFLPAIIFEMAKAVTAGIAEIGRFVKREDHKGALAAANKRAWTGAREDGPPGDERCRG
jgi:hypothetical protein